MARKARLGRPPKPTRLRRTRRLQMLLTAEEHRKLTRYAQERGITVSDLMRAHIRALLGQAEE